MISNNNTNKILEVLNSRINLVQSTQEINYNEYESITSTDTKKFANAYSNKQREKNLFAFDEYHAKSIEKEVVRKIASNPYAYNAKIENFAENFLTSLMTKSKSKNKKQIKEEVQHVSSTLNGIIKDRSLSDIEVQTKISETLDEISFVRTLDEDMASLFKNGDDNEKAEFKERFNNQLKNITNIVVENRDTCLKIQDKLERRGDSKVTALTKRLSEVAVEIENSREKLIKSELSISGKRGNTESGQIDNKVKREIDRKIHECIYDGVKPNEVFIASNNVSKKNQEEIIKHIEDFEKTSQQLHERQRKMEVSSLIATTFFKYNARAKNLYSPSDFFAEKNRYEHIRTESQENNFEDTYALEERTNDAKEKIYKELLLNNIDDYNESEAKDLVEKFSQNIKDTFIDRKDRKLYESLMSNFEHNVNTENNDDTSIKVMRDMLYNNMTDGNSIDIVKNIDEDNYVFDKKTEKEIFTMHNLERLTNKVANKEITANEAKKLLNGKDHILNEMDSQTRENTKEMMDLLSETSVSQNTDSSKSFFVLSRAEEMEKKKNADSIYQQTEHAFKKSLIDEMTLQKDSANNLTQTTSWMVGNKNNFEELEVCSNKQVPSRDAETTASIIDGCMQRFEQGLESDTKQLRDNFSSLGDSPVASFTGIPILVATALLLQQIAQAEHLNERMNADMKISEVVKHLKRVPSEKEKELLSILYRVDLAPKSKIKMTADKENIEKIEDELTFQTFMKAGNREIEIDGEQIRLDELDFEAESTNKTLATEAVFSAVIEKNYGVSLDLMEELKNDSSVEFSYKPEVDEFKIEQLSEKITMRKELLKTAQEGMQKIMLKHGVLKNSVNDVFSIGSEVEEKIKNNEAFSKRDKEQALYELKTQIKLLNQTKSEFSNLRDELLDLQESSEKQDIKTEKLEIVTNGNFNTENIDKIIKKDPAALMYFLSNMDTFKQIHGADAIKDNVTNAPFLKKAYNNAKDLFAFSNNDVYALENAVKSNKETRNVLQELNHVILNKSISDKSGNLLDKKYFDEILAELDKKDLGAYNKTMANIAQNLSKTNDPKYNNKTIEELLKIAKKENIVFNSEKSINKMMDFGVIEKDSPIESESILTFTTKEHAQKYNEKLEDYIEGYNQNNAAKIELDNRAEPAI